MYKSCAPGPELRPGDDAGMEDALAGQPDNLGQSTLNGATFFRAFTQVNIFCHLEFIIDGSSGAQEPTKWELIPLSLYFGCNF